MSILGRLIPKFWDNISSRNEIRNEYKQMRSDLKHQELVQVPFHFRDKGSGLGDKAEDVHLRVLQTIEDASSSKEEKYDIDQAVEYEIPESNLNQVESAIEEAIDAINRENRKAKLLWGIFIAILLIVISATIVLPQLLT
ncbi:hypothetical protein [Halomarina oriensis]|uniref:Uncharacterized protein n=1 Tax=Halomarina oriensis TaxID=671145 RepID=A0A6B0GKW9_9EURY|nr:hypothetical protein [Halomarina oriensis]MWG35394.1 hypothetical protein [Halomarina oriensis]